MRWADDGLEGPIERKPGEEGNDFDIRRLVVKVCDAMGWLMRVPSVCGNCVAQACKMNLMACLLAAVFCRRHVMACVDHWRPDYSVDLFSGILSQPRLAAQKIVQVLKERGFCLVQANAPPELVT